MGKKPIRCASACIASLVLALLAAAPAQAQKLGGKNYPERNVVELGGTVQFSFNKMDDEDYKTYTLVLGPMAGIFLAKGFQLGVSPIFYLLVQEGDGLKLTTYAGGAAIFARYVIPVPGVVFPFIAMNFGATGGETKSKEEDHEYSRTMNDLFLGPEIGIKIAVGRGALLTLSLNYTFTSTGVEHVDDRTEAHAILFGTGIGFWL